VAQTGIVTQKNLILCSLGASATEGGLTITQRQMPVTSGA